MDKAVRYSKKRSAVYDVLCSTTSHPTAEWIYSRVKHTIDSTWAQRGKRSAAIAFCRA